MFKVFRKTIALLAILFFCFTGLAFAASSTDEAVLGNDRWSVTNGGDFLPVASNTYNIGSSSYPVADIHYNGVLTPGTSAQQKFGYGLLATGDTLTAAKSGRSLVLTTITASGGKVTLPASAVGLKYVIIDGKQSTDTFTFSVDPASTSDTIVYYTSGTPLDAGDKLTSPGATGDSLTLICAAAGKWYVEQMKGTWTDGGA